MTGKLLLCLDEVIESHFAYYYHFLLIIGIYIPAVIISYNQVFLNYYINANIFHQNYSSDIFISVSCICFHAALLYFINYVNNAKYFSIVSIDASNHGHQKIFLVIVQYFSLSEGGLQFKLLDVDELENEKSEAVINYI